MTQTRITVVEVRTGSGVSTYSREGGIRDDAGRCTHSGRSAMKRTERFYDRIDFDLARESKKNRKRRHRGGKKHKRRNRDAARRGAEVIELITDVRIAGGGR